MWKWEFTKTITMAGPWGVTQVCSIILTVSWLSGLLSVEIFISTGELEAQMPPLTAESSHFLGSGSQEAVLVMLLFELPTVHHGSGSPRPRVSYRMSLGKSACKNLVIISESSEEPQEMVIIWKSCMEERGLRGNMDKAKVLISGSELNVLKKTNKDPSAMCLSGVGTNSIFYDGCFS